MRNVTPVPYQLNITLSLIVINVLVFLLTTLSPVIGNYLGLYPPFVLRYGMVWQFFTYMFVHGGISHLLMNMLGLFFFGAAVERALGWKKFLVFYILTGLTAGIFSFVFFFASGYLNVFLVGASGAIFGILFLFAVLFPTARIYVMGIIPVKAPVLVIIYTLIELYSQIFGTASGIAHMTHLSGFAFAIAYSALYLRINPVQVFFPPRRY